MVAKYQAHYRRNCSKGIERNGASQNAANHETNGESAQVISCVIRQESSVSPVHRPFHW